MVSVSVTGNGPLEGCSHPGCVEAVVDGPAPPTAVAQQMPPLWGWPSGPTFSVSLSCVSPDSHPNSEHSLVPSVSPSGFCPCLGTIPVPSSHVWKSSEGGSTTEIVESTSVSPPCPGVKGCDVLLSPGRLSPSSLRGLILFCFVFMCISFLERFQDGYLPCS